MKSKKENIAILREKYLIEECKKRGWNIDLLSTGQLLFIVSTPEYKAKRAEYDKAKRSTPEYTAYRKEYRAKKKTLETSLEK